MDDYGEYNGDTVHDMWTDYTYEEWTGQDVTGSGNSYEGTQTGNHAPANRRARASKQTKKEKIRRLNRKIDRCLKNNERDEKRLVDIDHKLMNQSITNARLHSLVQESKALKENLEARHEKVNGLKADVESLKLEIKADRQRLINLAVLAACGLAVFLAYALI